MKIPKIFAKRPYQKKDSVNKFSSSSLIAGHQLTDSVGRQTAQPYNTSFYDASSYEAENQDPIDDVESLKKLYEEISMEIKHISKIIEDSSAIAVDGDCGYRRYVNYNAWSRQIMLKYKIAKEPSISSVFVVKCVLESLALGTISERDIRDNMTNTCKELGVKINHRGNISGCNVDIGTVCGVLNALGVITSAHHESEAISDSRELLLDLSDYRNMVYKMSPDDEEGYDTNYAEVLSKEIELLQSKSSIVPLLASLVDRYLLSMSKYYRDNRDSSKAAAAAAQAAAAALVAEESRLLLLKSSNDTVAPVADDMLLDALDCGLDTMVGNEGQDLLDSTTTVDEQSTLLGQTVSTIDNSHPIADTSSSSSSGGDIMINNNNNNNNIKDGNITIEELLLDKVKLILPGSPLGLLHHHDDHHHLPMDTHDMDLGHVHPEILDIIDIGGAVGSNVSGIEIDNKASGVGLGIGLATTQQPNKARKPVSRKIPLGKVWTVDKSLESHVKRLFVLDDSDDSDEDEEEQEEETNDNTADETLPVVLVDEAVAMDSTTIIIKEGTVDATAEENEAISKERQSLLGEWARACYEEQVALEQEEAVMRRIAGQCGLQLQEFVYRSGTKYLQIPLHAMMHAISLAAPGAAGSSSSSGSGGGLTGGLGGIDGFFQPMLAAGGFGNPTSLINGCQFTAQTLWEKMRRNKRKLDGTIAGSIPQFRRDGHLAGVGNNGPYMPGPVVLALNTKHVHPLLYRWGDFAVHPISATEYNGKPAFQWSGGIYASSYEAAMAAVTLDNSSHVMPDLIFRTTELPWELVAKEFVAMENSDEFSFISGTNVETAARKVVALSSSNSSSIHINSHNNNSNSNSNNSNSGSASAGDNGPKKKQRKSKLVSVSSDSSFSQAMLIDQNNINNSNNISNINSSSLPVETDEQSLIRHGDVVAPNYKEFNIEEIADKEAAAVENGAVEQPEDLSDEAVLTRHELVLKNMRDTWAELQRLRMELKHGIIFDAEGNPTNMAYPIDLGNFNTGGYGSGIMRGFRGGGGHSRGSHGYDGGSTGAAGGSSGHQQQQHLTGASVSTAHHGGASQRGGRGRGRLPWVNRPHLPITVPEASTELSLSASCDSLAVSAPAIEIEKAPAVIGLPVSCSDSIPDNTHTIVPTTTDTAAAAVQEAVPYLSQSQSPTRRRGRPPSVRKFVEQPQQLFHAPTSADPAAYISMDVTSHAGADSTLEDPSGQSPVGQEATNMDLETEEEEEILAMEVDAGAKVHELNDVNALVADGDASLESTNYS